MTWEWLEGGGYWENRRGSLFQRGIRTVKKFESMGHGSLVIEEELDLFYSIVRTLLVCCIANLIVNDSIP